MEAPSFSLGLDFTFDSQPPELEPEPEPEPPSPIHPPPINDGNDLNQEEVPDSDPDAAPDPPRRILKRLRRGLPPQPQQPQQQQQQQQEPVFNFDDEDIEEFSSQDNDHDRLRVNAHSSTRSHPVCSSSKVSLSGSGFLTPHSSSRVTKRKEPCPDDVPVSAKMETGYRGLMFPKLTTSPLRRFKLLSDSDSDSDSDVEEIVASKENKNAAAPVQQSTTKSKCSVDQDHDLWKDFSPVKKFSIPTPAFDELCEEYYQSVKNKGVANSGIDVAGSCSKRSLGVNTAKNKESESSGIHVAGSCGTGHTGINSSCQGDQQHWESEGPLPPAHRYFFHADPRIQQLVRSRLSNFSPLGINKVNQQANASNIDYMGQFGNGGASAQKGPVKSSTRGNNRSRNFSAEENLGASEGWVDPRARGVSQFSNGESSRKKATKRNGSKKNQTNKSSSLNVSHTTTNWVEPKSRTSMPKDAGKRRVQASGQSVGHWFTSPEGRKVYVNKSGQELTGQAAYRQYRRESGAGSRKSKKKTSVKRENSKKRNRNN
ncbi:hypothetical protein HN51_023782 [Arachis hypogaea]|uniref:Uncharacterized protein n=1 Tax=Arachis hypogaea TaxID=3818 RepID=A0A445C3H4_ARAHY|nr:uncharacterized protein LOC112701966 [Arachis hypogaea]QHO26731.1 uncharacterized protein DS421_7g202050 [Arachis hypogaea]RYR45477.1 hypothetical protein Ahy_A07g031303 isoform A [Arachis hypogaea]